MRVQHSNHEASRGSMTSYIIGFGLSLALTSVAFWLVKKHVDSGHTSPTDNVVLATLAVLAISQLFVQLIFFLHLDRESKPRWNNTVLAFAAIVVLILVGGSIWIMTNLDYHHGTAEHGHSQSVEDEHGHEQTPDQLDQSIIKDEGVNQ